MVNSFGTYYADSELLPNLSTPVDEVYYFYQATNAIGKINNSFEQSTVLDVCNIISKTQTIKFLRDQGVHRFPTHIRKTVKVSFIGLVNVNGLLNELGPSDASTDTKTGKKEQNNRYQSPTTYSSERITRMSINFDTLTNVKTDLEGAITEVEVYDSDMDPNHVLPRNREWHVRVKWQVKGLCAPGLGGDWHVRVNLESMGQGFEGTVKQQTVAVNSIAPALALNYDETIALPRPDTISGFIAGTYKLIVIITHTNTGGGVTKRTRMTGFFDSYLLEFDDFDV